MGRKGEGEKGRKDEMRPLLPFSPSPNSGGVPTAIHNYELQRISN